VTQRVKVSHDAIFDEGRDWDWSTPDVGSSASAASDFTIEYWELGGAEGAQGASLAAPRSPSPNLGVLGRSSEEFGRCSKVVGGARKSLDRAQQHLPLHQ
jgi:hypothetical protein